MSRRPTPLPEPWAGRPFRIKDAMAKGVGERRLRGTDGSAPFSGVRVLVAADESVGGRCRSYAAVMAPGQFFSHRTAARLHGIPLPWPEGNEPLHCDGVPARSGP